MVKHTFRPFLLSHQATMADHLKPSGASTADSEKTAAASKTPSVMDYEKTDVRSVELQTAPGTANSKEQAVDEPNQAEEDDEDNDEDYPKAWRLAVITIALCLSVFCMALVRVPCTYLLVVGTLANNLDRTTPLSQPLSRASQISSRLLMTSAGMVLPIFSPPARHNSSTENSTPSTRSNGSTSPPCSSSKSVPSSAVLRPTRPH